MFGIDIVYVLLGGILFLLLFLFIISLTPGKDKNMKPQEGRMPKFDFILATNRNKLHFNPYDGFIAYAGANSGKTKSIGKPLLREYIRYFFAGFVYDYKDFDLTRTVNHLCKKFDYPYNVYNISFTDLNKSHRTNPISPKVVGDENLFIQLITDLLDSYILEGKKNEWYNGALGILRGVAINFFHLYPDICTIPHIVNFICSAGSDRLVKFVEQTYESRVLASAFLDAKESPKTKASYLSTLTNYISVLAFNKNISYILTGNDFEFNLIDPKDPKLVCVANSYQMESLISPIIALMLTLSSRRFTMNNNIPFVFFLDEATSFTIPDFEKMPSVLREYKCSFTVLTQSGAKLEKRYGKLDRSSIEANLANQFYGRTKDVEALKYYPVVFGKFDKKKKSKTTGSSTTGSNQSQTISTQKEDKYDSSFFTRLSAGQFVGTANKRDFFAHFDMYKEEEEPLPVVRTVFEKDIDRCIEKIREDIKCL
jgi:mobilization protein C